MKLRRIRGPNCDEASDNATKVSENTTPAIVIIEPAMVCSTALAPSAPPLYTQSSLLSHVLVTPSSIAPMRKDSPTAAAAMREGRNQKLDRKRSRYFFLHNNLKHHCLMGNDYYQTNEHHVNADGTTCASGEIFGYADITRQYYDRYRLPVMHTETNLAQGPVGDEAVRWLRKEWANVLSIRNSGIPVVGFTWYSLTDQVDWDTALREDNGRVNPLGLFDLDRNIRPVGVAYRDLIHAWGKVLPTQSVCLQVPIALPQDHPSPVPVATPTATGKNSDATTAAPKNSE